MAGIIANEEGNIANFDDLRSVFDEYDDETWEAVLEGRVTQRPQELEK